MGLGLHARARPGFQARVSGPVRRCWNPWGAERGGGCPQLLWDPLNFSPSQHTLFVHELITKIKAIFSAFSACSGWFVPSVRGGRGSPAVARGSPRPRQRREAPGKGRRGKRREAKRREAGAGSGGPGRAGRKTVRGRSGAQEGARGQGSGGGLGARKGSERKGGSRSPRKVPPERCRPSRGLGPPLPARALCSGLGPRERAVLKCRSRLS